jgi:cell division protein FtsB
MDPNIQVAFISVLATIVTTVGVVTVAVLNNRKERDGAASAGVEAGLDERDILGRMLSLIAENERKEKHITELQADKKDLQKENRELRAENKILRGQIPGEEDEGK